MSGKIGRRNRKKKSVKKRKIIIIENSQIRGAKHQGKRSPDLKSESNGWNCISCFLYWIPIFPFHLVPSVSLLLSCSLKFSLFLSPLPLCILSFSAFHHPRHFPSQRSVSIPRSVSLSIGSVSAISVSSFQLWNWISSHFSNLNDRIPRFWYFSVVEWFHFKWVVVVFWFIQLCLRKFSFLPFFFLLF